MTEAARTLAVAGLRGGYGGDDILCGVTLEVPEHSIVAVVGPNGSGKSTLLKAICGIVRPREGSIAFTDDGGDDHQIVRRPPHAIARLGIGYVPQTQNVFADMSVRENLEIGAFGSGRKVADQLERVLSTFPLLEQRLTEIAGKLSTGQRQLVALGRALMASPSLLMLDEPSAGLAPQIVEQVFDHIRMVRDTGVTILIVEQKAREILAMADYGYVLELGCNRYEGPGAQLLHDEEVVRLYLGGRSAVSAPAARR
jgi:ABC-type branched-subunit amino acid transport system ATPase component